MVAVSQDRGIKDTTVLRSIDRVLLALRKTDVGPPVVNSRASKTVNKVVGEVTE